MIIKEEWKIIVGKSWRTKLGQLQIMRSSTSRQTRVHSCVLSALIRYGERECRGRERTIDFCTVSYIQHFEVVGANKTECTLKDFSRRFKQTTQTLSISNTPLSSCITSTSALINNYNSQPI